jgi:hypothetical protein
MWDSFIKNFGIVATIATLVGSAIAFFMQRSDDIAQRRIQAEAIARDSKKVFLDKQATLYFETTALISRLATMDAETIPHQDVERFWQLYWGELSMVEDFGVEQSMVLFGRSLRAAQQGTNVVCAQERKEISLMLAHCMRESLGKSWDVELGATSRNRCTESEFEKMRQVCP